MTTAQGSPRTWGSPWAPRAGAILYAVLVVVSLPSTLTGAAYILDPMLPLPGTRWLFSVLRFLFPPVLFAPELTGLLGGYFTLLCLYMLVEPWVRRFPAELRDPRDWVPGRQPSLWRIVTGTLRATAGFGFALPGAAGVLVSLWFDVEAFWLVSQLALIGGGALIWAAAWRVRRLIAVGTLVPGRVEAAEREVETVRVPMHDHMVPMRAPPTGTIFFSYEHGGRTYLATARLSVGGKRPLGDDRACWVLLDPAAPERALLLDAFLPVHLRRFLRRGAFAGG